MNEAVTLAVGPAEMRALLAILKTHVPDRAVWAFGSRTRGMAKPYSDLDLVILGDVPLTLDRLAALRESLSESDLPWKVDLVEWARASDAFRRIMAEHKVVVQDAV